MASTTLQSPKIVRRSGGFYSWPLLAIRGLAALLFAVAALLAFQETFTLLIWFFAVYVFYDGSYALLVALSHVSESAMTRMAITLKGLLGIVAGAFVLYQFFTSGAELLTLLAVFIWVAVAGVLEGVWVIKNVKNKELLLIIGSTAYLALAVALQFLFAVAPAAGAPVYKWVIIGFSAAFGLAMLLMSWAMRRKQIN
ncbi:MAG: hypothetical protein JJ693_07130 [Acidithiobacillus sp.]|nr:hypothetical protein [Acidithiobacillus sp.]